MDLSGEYSSSYDTGAGRRWRGNGIERRDRRPGVDVDRIFTLSNNWNTVTTVADSITGRIGRICWQPILGLQQWWIGAQRRCWSWWSPASELPPSTTAAASATATTAAAADGQPSGRGCRQRRHQPERTVRFGATGRAQRHAETESVLELPVHLSWAVGAGRQSCV